MSSDPSRKPHKATLRGRPDDRRLNRLAPDPCSRCGCDDLRVMLRTDYVVYYRCEHSLQMWSGAKPGEQFGT